MKNICGAQLFHALTGLENVALILLDVDGKITKCSPAAEDFYGYQEEELLRESFTRFFPEEEKSCLKESLHQIQPSKKIEYKGLQVRKDLSVFQSKVVYTSIPDQYGFTQGYLMLSKDLTAENSLDNLNELFKKRLEEEVNQRTRQLQIANEELEAFSYSVSHDLRAPLRAINGFSQVLIEQYGTQLDAEGMRLLEIVHWNADLMGQLIDDLLKFSRLSKLNVIAESVNMASLVNKAMSLLLTPIHTSNYNIEIRSLHPCIGDESMLLQVWMNLIDNALKYSSKTTNPFIEIGSVENLSTVTYYIKDNGAGFDVKYADKLFGVFQRLHSQAMYSGTGLGLALIKRIICKHGGEIYAEGEVNKGAEFRFTLQKKS